MSKKDHPNNTPDVPMVFPSLLHRLQVKYFNPMIMPLARHAPGFAIVKHRGRRSGKPYETIVNAYRRGNTLAIALGHGKAEWVKNVLAAGEAEIHLFRRDIRVVNPRVVPAGTDDPSMPFDRPPGRAAHPHGGIHRRHRLTLLCHRERLGTSNSHLFNTHRYQLTTASYNAAQ